MKERYERTELEIIKFQRKDIIVTSDFPEDDELPVVTEPATQ